MKESDIKILDGSEKTGCFINLKFAPYISAIIAGGLGYWLSTGDPKFHELSLLLYGTSGLLVFTPAIINLLRSRSSHF